MYVSLQFALLGLVSNTCFLGLCLFIMALNEFGFLGNALSDGPCEFTVVNSDTIRRERPYVVYYCLVCNMWMQEEQYVDHPLGRKHYKNKWKEILAAAAAS